MSISDLIQAVEAGTLPQGDRVADILDQTHPHAYSLLGPKVRAAFEGSLDAARALHEAVLPGWGASILTNGDCYVCHDRHGLFDADIEDNPARAWLLSILKALEAQQ